MGLFGAKLSEVFCRACESRISVQQKAGYHMRKHQLWGALGGVFIVMLMSVVPYVDWAAHLGGLMAGIAVGMIIFAMKIESLLWRIFWAIIGTILTLTYFIVTLKYMYNDVEPADELRDVCTWTNDSETVFLSCNSLSPLSSYIWSLFYSLPPSRRLLQAIL